LLVLVCFERKVLLAGSWWLVCSERKNYWLMANKPNEQADYNIKNEKYGILDFSKWGQIKHAWSVRVPVCMDKL
jgi:hypothetical protein